MALPNDLIAVGAVAVLASATTWWSVRRAAAAELVGDEHEYAALLANRPGPVSFRRMPGHGWLLRGLRRIDNTRRAGAVASIAASIATTALAADLVDPWAAFVVGVLAVFASERLLLAPRLWPEPLLALGNVVLVAACVPTMDVHWSTVAFVCALLTLGRIDGMITAVCMALVVPAPLVGRLAVAGAGVAPVVGLALVRHLRGGVGPIETTGWFNVRLSAARLGSAGHEPLESTITELAAKWQGETDDERRSAARAAMMQHARHPLRWAHCTGTRLLGLCGVDSFSAQRVVPSFRPSLHRTAARASTTVGAGIVVLALMGMAAATAPRVSWLVGLQAAAMSLFHTRTRFRAVLLPGLTVLGAAGLHHVSTMNADAVLVGLAGVATVALASHLDLLERHRTPAPDDGQ